MARIRKIDEIKAIELFAKVNSHNWDLGYKTPTRALKNKNCDLGTVALIYWRTDPHYYLKYKDESQVKQHDMEGWRFVHDVEQQLLSGKYPELISVNPKSKWVCQQYKANRSQVRELPAQVYRVVPGKIDANEIIQGRIGPGALNHAATNNDVKLLDKLLDEGKDVHFTHQESTPLMAATRANSLQAIKRLIQRGADVNHKGDFYPIHLVNEVRTLKLLLDSGAKVDIGSPGGFTATHFVAGGTRKSSQNTVLKCLIENGAEPNLKQKYFGITALHRAARGGYINNLRTLLSAGWELEALDKEKGNLLHHAISAMTRHPVGKRNKVPMVRELVRLGVSADAENSWCHSAKGLATYSVRVELQQKDEVYRILGIPPDQPIET